MIRPYHQHDLEALIAVWLAASTFAHPFLDEAFHLEGPAMIRDVYMPNAETWVYEREGKVVGFLSLLDNEVGAIFVEPQQHGHGIGRSLLDHAQTIRPTLFLEVFRENQRSVNFYLKYGFMAVSERPHESLGHTLIRMELQ